MSTKKKEKTVFNKIFVTLGVASAAATAYLAVGNALYEAFLVTPDKRRLKKANFNPARMLDPASVEKFRKNPESIPDEFDWFAAFASKTESIVSLRGKNITANIAEHEEKTDKWVIFCHGYTSNPALESARSRVFYNHGFNVLYPNLNGHALSERRDATMGWLDRLDVLDWASYIATKNPDSQIVLYGLSMGAATVMMATGEELIANVKCCVEDCGFTSVNDIITVCFRDKTGLPEFPFLNAAKTVMNLRMGFRVSEGSALNQVRKSKTPTLFIHGDKDGFVPFWMHSVLYDNAKCEKEKLIIKGADHVQSSNVDPELYWGTIFKFIEKHLK